MNNKCLSTDIGCSQSPLKTLLHICQQELPTSKDNLKEAVEKLPIYTGKSIAISSEQLELPLSKRSLEKESTLNLPEAKRPQITFGKTSLELKEPNLNLGENHSNVIVKKTGIPSEQWLKTTKWNPSLPTSLLGAIPTLKGSQLKVLNRNQLKNKFMSFGAKLEPENPEEPGKKLDGKRTQKHQRQSSGMDTEAKSMLLWMSSEDKLRYLIYYAGWIDIQSLLKLKVVQRFSKQKKYGLRLICLQKIGIQTLMKKQEMLYSEGSSLPTLMDYEHERSKYE